MLDIISAVFGAIAAFLIIGVLIALAIAFILYRFLTNLSVTERTAIIAGLIVIGLVLIVSVAGAEFGVISLLAGVFTQVFQAVAPRKGEAES